MRKPLCLVGLCAIAVMLMVRSAGAEPTKFVQITEPFAKVYRYLDPKSEVIKLARKGESFELVYEGTSWYQIKIKDSVGWLEHRYGVITDAPHFLAFSVSFWTLALFVVLLLGTLGGVSYMIYRRKAEEQ
jgi:hypothetical protein